MGVVGDDRRRRCAGITLVIHYGLAKLPEEGYKPRLADQRVGYFISRDKGLRLEESRHGVRPEVNRWRLEKSDPKAALSPPKRQLVWWVEDTMPHEYRPYVERGSWNEQGLREGGIPERPSAFGGRTSGDDFDPKTSTLHLRWITTPVHLRDVGPACPPITGEMIDGDVQFRRELDPRLEGGVRVPRRHADPRADRFDHRAASMWARSSVRSWPASTARIAVSAAAPALEGRTARARPERWNLPRVFPRVGRRCRCLLSRRPQTRAAMPPASAPPPSDTSTAGGHGLCPRGRKGKHGSCPQPEDGPDFVHHDLLESPGDETGPAGSLRLALPPRGKGHGRRLYSCRLAVCALAGGK